MTELAEEKALNAFKTKRVKTVSIRSNPRQYLFRFEDGSSVAIRVKPSSTCYGASAKERVDEVNSEVDSTNNVTKKLDKAGGIRNLEIRDLMSLYKKTTNGPALRMIEDEMDRRYRGHDNDIVDAVSKAYESVNIVNDADNWKHNSMEMRCKTCMWHEVDEGSDADADEKRGRRGSCKKDAPTTLGWPVTWEMDWCGAHKINYQKLFNCGALRAAQRLEQGMVNEIKDDKPSKTRMVFG